MVFDKAAAAAALALGVVAMLSGGCKPETNTFVAPPPPDVTVAHPVRKAVTDTLEYTGSTEAYESIDLRARVTGFLERVGFKPGGKVQKGDVLFVIDKRPFNATVDRLQAQVHSDEAAFRAAESDARIAEQLSVQRAGSEIDKIIKIGKRDSAKAAVEAANAALESARLDLEFCEIKSPIDGRITKNFVDVGNLVGPQVQPAVLGTIVSSKPIYVSIDVSDVDLLTVRRRRMSKAKDLEPGQVAEGRWQTVDLAIGSEGEFATHGHVDYVDPALNPQTATIHVRCRFENDDDFLLPGLYVRLRFPMETADAIMAPDIALPSDQAGRYALVVNEQNVVEIRRVKVGQLDGGLRVVVEGLAPTDRMVVNGLQRARPGLTVHPMTQEPAGGADGESRPVR